VAPSSVWTTERCIRRAPSENVIEVLGAAATDVIIGTESGKVELSGPLGAVWVATVSGKIRIEAPARIVDLAGPGEVLCSEATADAIGDRADGRVTGTSSR
jgi:class 3 adenylate cyclase